MSVRSRVPRIGVIVALAAIFAACGSSTSSGAASSPSGAAPSAAAPSAAAPSVAVEPSAAAFPVTLEHAFGSTTIEAQPERIVTIGWASQDVVAALGVVPVATTDFTWGTVDKYLPWFKDTVEALGGPLPEIIRYTDAQEVDFEQILGLEPDVILALHAGLSDNEYARLSDIAPTVAYKDRAWTSDWKELTRTVGTVLGQPDEADALVADVEADIAAQAAAHPEFSGRTFTYGWYLADGATAMDLYVPEDPRVQLIEQLGFTTSPQVVEISKGAENFYVSVSLEELESVESDFHIGWIDTPPDLERTLDNALVKQWAPIAANSYFMMEDQGLAWASSQPSVLSIPWQLDTIVPAISEALAPAS